MTKRESKEQANLPPCPNPIVGNPTWCAMGATEDERVIAAGAARPTLGTRRERRCRG